ncbi:MAG TPA: alpha/beta hydrolase [Chloroflexota bacterium]
MRNAQVEVLERGEGPPLLYLHGIWDAEHNLLLERLAAGRRVIAPRLPGFGGSTGEEHLASIHDAVYYFLDLLDAIGLEGGPLVGHCLGGMFAAELAAVQPQRFSRLALIAPFGLWNSAHPVPDFFAAAPEEVEAWAGAGMPAKPAPEDEEAAMAAALAQAKAMSAAARFLWPLPNHGFKSRAHRVAVPSLLVWGSRDGICPPEYGREFQELIRGSRVEIVEDAGHLPHNEQPDRVAEVLTSFLTAEPSP